MVCVGTAGGCRGGLAVQKSTAILERALVAHQVVPAGPGLELGVVDAAAGLAAAKRMRELGEVSVVSMGVGQVTVAVRSLE